MGGDKTGTGFPIIDDPNSAESEGGSVWCGDRALNDILYAVRSFDRIFDGLRSGNLEKFFLQHSDILIVEADCAQPFSF